MNSVHPSSDVAVRELCSALLDDELDEVERRRGLDRLKSDAAARADWVLWQYISDALQSPEVARWHRPDFAQRLEAALAAEPALLAPSPARPVRRILLPALATAAAAALLAVVAVPMLMSEQSPAPQIAARPAPPAIPATGPLQRSPQVEAYLAAHRELAGAPTMPRSAPYLRAALESDGRSR